MAADHGNRTHRTKPSDPSRPALKAGASTSTARPAGQRLSRETVAACERERGSTRPALKATEPRALRPGSAWARNEEGSVHLSRPTNRPTGRRPAGPVTTTTRVPGQRSPARGQHQHGTTRRAEAIAGDGGRARARKGIDPTGFEGGASTSTARPAGQRLSRDPGRARSRRLQAREDLRRSPARRPTMSGRTTCPPKRRGSERRVVAAAGRARTGERPFTRRPRRALGPRTTDTRR